MRITTVASGSSGNCSLVSSAGAHIIIDAGIPYKRAALAMAENNLIAKQLSGILITHSHSDHISGLPVFMRRLGAPVFAPEDVCVILREKFGAPQGLLNKLSPGESFSLGPIKISSFKTSHDAPDSMGFRFDEELSPGGAAYGDSVGYCTDLGRLTDEVLANLRGVSCALIESNHDKIMLKNGPYPPFLKKRILSDYGHLSNDSGAELALLLAQSGTRKLILAHLSRENNTPALARGAVKKRLRASGFDPDKEITLYIAPQNESLSVSAAADSPQLTLCLP